MKQKPKNATQGVPTSPSAAHPDAHEVTVSLPATPEDVTLTHGAANNAEKTEFPKIEGYKFLRLIGEGGMGAVFLAEDVRLGRKVAIKTMKFAFASNRVDRERFEREARAAAAVEHDNIVPIWQIGESISGIPFIAMPYLQGEMLEARLRSVTWELLLKVALDVAEGLAAAHAKGLIHRDIKPGNIWLECGANSTTVNRCKILDFGLARAVENDDSGITSEGAIQGTPAYMAPEQGRGERVDHRADLFSLGVMLYRMATGRPPFLGKNAMAVLVALATETPRPPGELNPKLPNSIATLIAHLMRKDPEARPQLASEVAESVKKITRELSAQGFDMTALVCEGIEPEHIATQLDDAPRPRPREPRSPIPQKKRLERKRNPLLWILLGVGAFLTLGFLACVLTILAPVLFRLTPQQSTQPNPTVAEVKHVDEKVGPGGRELVVKPLPATDREAAMWVLSVGGTVDLDDRANKTYWKVEELPKDSFRLTTVSLNNKFFQEDDLAIFQGCKHIQLLYLLDTPTTNAGLAHFQNNRGLHHIHLKGTKVTDAGLVHLANCKNLAQIHLTELPIGDDGLKHLAGCDKLSYLDLAGTKVTDAGLGHFKNCKKLSSLVLAGTSVGDKGLANFKDCKELLFLNLGNTNIGDDGLEHLQGFPKLKYLHLFNTQVSDKCVKTITTLKVLEELKLRGTKVSSEGIEAMTLALPKCKITRE